MPFVVNAMAIKPTVRATSADVFSKGKNYVNIQEASTAGLVGASAPLPEAFDVLGFCNGIDGSTLQRYREADLTPVSYTHLTQPTIHLV